MRLDDHYDLIVIGDQLSGLMLAAHAAQNNCRVLIIEGNSRECSIHAKPSGQFLGELHWEPILGLSDGSSLDQFFQQLGLYTELDSLFPRLDPAVQIVSKHCRVEIDYSVEEMIEQWIRECPVEKDHLGRFTLDWLKGNTGLLQASCFSDLLQKNQLGLAWQPLGLMQALLYGAIVFEDAPLVILRKIIDNASNGVRYIRGGRDVLKERLISRLKYFGGQVKRDAWVEEIVFEEGKLSGVLLSTFEGFVRANAVVGSMGASRFAELIPTKNRTESLQHELRRLQPTHWRFSYSLRLPRKLIPEGLARHVCLYEHSIDYSETDIIQMFILDADSAQGIRDDGAVILVRLLMPYTESSLQKSQVQVAMKKSLNEIRKLLPLVDSSQWQMSPDVTDLENDYVFKNYLAFKGLEYIPSDWLVYGGKAKAGLEGNWRKFGMNGLGVSSRDVQPSLGLLGEALTARQLFEDLALDQSRVH